jgi:hypothetical protein
MSMSPVFQKSRLRKAACCRHQPSGTRKNLGTNVADFVMPTRDEFLVTLRTQRVEMVAHYDAEGWTAASRKLLKRMDKLIAKAGA